MFYRNAYLFYGKAGAELCGCCGNVVLQNNIFFPCIKAGAGLANVGQVAVAEDVGLGVYSKKTDFFDLRVWCCYHLKAETNAPLQEKSWLNPKLTVKLS